MIINEQSNMDAISYIIGGLWIICAFLFLILFVIGIYDDDDDL